MHLPSLSYDADVTSLDAPIRTERLDLVLLTAAWLRAFVEGDPVPELGFTDPHDFLAESAHVVNMRLEQLALDPSQEPWLLRAVVPRTTGAAVGYANFHAPPDQRGMVEIGYQVLPAHRHRGYATEAAHGMWAWAAEHGAQVFRASVSPDNVHSLALVHRAGFTEVGEQMDEVDGFELILERAAPSAVS